MTLNTFLIPFMVSTFTTITIYLYSVITCSEILSLKFLSTIQIALTGTRDSQETMLVCNPALLVVISSHWYQPHCSLFTAPDVSELLVHTKSIQLEKHGVTFIVKQLSHQVCVDERVIANPGCCGESTKSTLTSRISPSSAAQITHAHRFSQLTFLYASHSGIELALWIHPTS